MKIGLALPQIGEDATPQVIKRFAQEAEAAGFAHLWVHEGLYNAEHDPRGPAGGPQDLSPFEILSFVAGVTERIRLGTSVITLGYHHPVMLAKQAATLDVLSDGRLILGVGLGLNKAEYELSGLDYHTRGKRSAEFIRALRALWADNPVSFEGEILRIPKGESSPKPLQRVDGQPGVPIIGGFRSRPGQKRTAELCDGWQTAGPTLEEAAAQYAQVCTWAAEFGRPKPPMYFRVWGAPAFTGYKPPKPVGDRVVPFWGGKIEDFLARVADCRDAGVDHLIIDTNRFMAEGVGQPCWDRIPGFFAPLVH